MKWPGQRVLDVLAAVAALGIYVLFAGVLPEEKAFICAMAIYVLYVIASEARFRVNGKVLWPALAVVALVQIVALTLLTVPKITGPSLAFALPFALLDGACLWVIVRALERKWPREER